jgi:hypothetical protein
MIMVDTSVLIDYFRDNGNDKTELFNQIQQRNLPFGINNFIYQECLQGCKTEKDYKLLKAHLDTQRFYYFKKGRESYAAAAHIYFELRKHGITVRSTIDCLIAQMVLENDLYLLHNDTDFTHMAPIINLKIWE